jgi:hypothetical protein
VLYKIIGSGLPASTAQFAYLHGAVLRQILQPHA